MKWGILGAGRIANRFSESLKNVVGCELYAVACRTQEKANHFQEKHPCKKAYAGFENIVNDPEIDAVYIAVPHQFHYEWIIKCLNAKKAVLCEKPACMNASEMKDVMECAKKNKTLFMEAMKTRFVPLYQEIKKRVESGEIGQLRSVSASFCNDIPKEMLQGSYYVDPRSGGALTDAGIYPIGWLEDYLKEDFTLSHLYDQTRQDVNYYTRAVLQFGKAVGTMECGMDRSRLKDAVLIGDRGTIVVKNMHRATEALIKGTEIEMSYDHDDFYSEISHFAELFKEGKIESPIMPFASSLRCAEIMDCIYAGRKYDEQTLSLLEKQEADLSFRKLSEEEIQRLGSYLIQDQEKYERNAFVRIVDERDDSIVFDYLPEDKDEHNIVYAEGKRRLAKKIGHSSFYAVVENELHHTYEDFIHDVSLYCPSAGAFGLIVHGEWRYTIEVSGLHEGEDHELIVNALYHLKGLKVPSFPYKIV